MTVYLQQCWLCPVSEQDWSGFQELFSDPLVRKMNGADTDIKASFEHYLSNDASFSIYVQGRMVGTVSLFETSLSNAVRSMNAREMTYALMPDHWGKGIMQETVGYVCDTVARKLGLDVILAGSFLENERSASVLKRNGFRPIFVRYGEYEELIYMRCPD